MKNQNKLKFIIIIFILCAAFLINCTNSFAAVQELEKGTYTSNDGAHTIKINDNGTILYDDIYSLSATANEKGDKLTGKLGTNKKSATFYQLNSSKIVSGAELNYTHDGTTVYLYDYTVFSLNVEPVIDENGSFEVWNNEIKVNTYADLQSAIDAAQNGNTVKITKDLDVIGGAYIKGKNITIEGENHTLNCATWANSIFIVEEDATLNINNITLDGKATGFEVNYEATNPKTRNKYIYSVKKWF